MVIQRSDITFVDNGVTAEHLSRFQQIAGWSERPLYQLQKALEKSLFSVAAVYNKEVVGIGRLIGDGVMSWYLKDIIILPEFQGRGIGRAMINYLLCQIEHDSLPGTVVAVNLMAAKGKEPFYEKLGFHQRPNDREGAGMQLKLTTRNDEGGETV